MSLFDFFAAQGNCPACGDPGARRFLWMVGCRNMACRHFDHESMQRADLQPPSMRPLGPQARFGAPAKVNVTIQYKNFRGEEKAFVGDAATARRRGNHISLCVEPTGKRIALSCDRITNLDEVNDRIPGTIEKRVLTYHRRRGTSSPRYEELRRKYPHLA